MTPRYPLSPDDGQPKTARPLAPSAATSRRGGSRASRIGGIKSLIAIASVATTIGGWAIFTNHDAAGVTQATAAPTDIVSLVSQISAAPTGTAIPILTTIATDMASSPPASPATATSQASAAQATATAADATATPIAPTATAMATTAPPTAIPAAPAPITTTRSSR